MEVMMTETVATDMAYRRCDLAGGKSTSLESMLELRFIQLKTKRARYPLSRLDFDKRRGSDASSSAAALFFALASSPVFVCSSSFDFVTNDPKRLLERTLFSRFAGGNNALAMMFVGCVRSPGVIFPSSLSGVVEKDTLNFGLVLC
jgi:hypothetical protein